MQTKTVEKVLKRSLIYSLAVTQPFTVNHAFATAIQDASIFEHKQLQYGDHGELVSHIQLKLKKLGYYEDRIDGVYGLYTEKAVRGFQSSEAVSVTGMINKETYEALLKTEKKSAFAQIEQQFYSIKYGEHSNNVRIVQEVLYFYGYYHGEVDGIYGPLTEEAIQKVENDNIYSINEPINENYTTSKASGTENVQLEAEKSDQDPIVIQLDIPQNNGSLIKKAKSLLGSPYVWGGTSPSGFDCSGFIQYVYQQENVTIPRTVNEIWNFSSPVSSPSVGDLVFFETYQPGPSHMGIYLGKGNFIHAGSSRGVEISNMNDNNYWKSRYLGAKRIH